jgi:pimeloyl-ACP methyl ester carboxylesterase
VQETASLIQGAQLIVLQGSGHIPAIDAPQTTAQTIATFLRGQNA